MPINLYLGSLDTLATVKDANWIKEAIPSINKYLEIEGWDHSTFNKIEDPWFHKEIISEL